MILEILGSNVVGGLIGIGGNWLKGREERENLKLTQQHELAMSQHEITLMKMEAEQQIQLAEIEGAIQHDLASMGAFHESIKSQSVLTGVKWVDGIRGLMRPLITLLLMAFCGYTLYQADVPQVDPTVLVSSITGLTSMSISWWFGSRSSGVRSK